MKKIKTIIQGIILAALLYLKFLDSQLWQKITSFHSTLELIFNFVVFLLTANLIVIFSSYYYRKRKKFKPAKRDNVLNGLQNLYYLTLTGAIIMTILGFWNIDAKTLFTTLSIVAAAIAIISKDYLAEIISGIIISFSNEISIDDYVKIGEHKGKVLDINLTKIALLNEDDDAVFLPNNKVFISEIVNYTKLEIRKVNVDFEIDIKFIKSVDELENDLISCLQDYHEHIEQNKFNLRIVSINKESLFLKFQFQLHRINRELEQEIRKKTVRRVVNYIKETNTPLQTPTPD